MKDEACAEVSFVIWSTTTISITLRNSMSTDARTVLYSLEKCDNTAPHIDLKGCTHNENVRTESETTNWCIVCLKVNSYWVTENYSANLSAPCVHTETGAFAQVQPSCSRNNWNVLTCTGFLPPVCSCPLYSNRNKYSTISDTDFLNR